jgi:hypothetical protein
LTVFEVLGGSVVVGCDGVLDPVGESGDGDGGQLLHRVELEAGHLDAVHCDEIALGRWQATAIEDKQELRAARTVGAVVPPVRDQKPPDRWLDAELFSDLALGRHPWALSRFDVSTGDVEEVLVGRYDEQDLLTLVDEQDASGNTRANERRVGLVHPIEPRAM